MMNFPNGGKLRFLIWNSGGMRWNGWKRNWFDSLRERTLEMKVAFLLEKS
jgi:hypothetical protein